MNRFVVISGCSGGGKSALLKEMRRRGHAAVDEPGRRIVTDERSRGGSALPWVDPAAFAVRAVEMALADRKHAKTKTGWVFFDRGLIDALAALEHATGKTCLHRAERHRYHRRVFLVPPWPEIFIHDEARRHGFDEAEREYDRLRHAFASLGYLVEVLPKIGIIARAELVLERLDEGLSK